MSSTMNPSSEPSSEPSPWVPTSVPSSVMLQTTSSGKSKLSVIILTSVLVMFGILWLVAIRTMLKKQGVSTAADTENPLMLKKQDVSTAADTENPLMLKQHGDNLRETETYQYDSLYQKLLNHPTETSRHSIS